MNTEMKKEARVSKGLTIEYDREIDGRWIAEIPELPGCIVYGYTKEEAEKNAIILAYRSILLDIEFGEEVPDL